jgi:tetratricopeptide (TPR) repeat protein
MNKKLFRTGGLVALLLIATFTGGCVQAPQPLQEPLPVYIAEVNMAQGITAFQYSNYGLAQQKFLNALAIYRGIDDPDGLVRACINLSETLLSQDRTKEAVTFLDMARYITERENFSQYPARIDIVASSIAIAENRLQDALTILNKYLRPVAPEGTENEIIAAALQNMVYLAFLSEDIAVEPWIERYARSLKETENVSPSSLARLYRFQGMLLQSQGSSEKSDGYFADALKIYRETLSRGSIAATHTEWARALIEQNRLQVAEDRLKRALAVRTEMRDRNGCLEVLKLLLEVRIRRGDKAGEEEVRQWLAEVSNPASISWPGILNF